MARRWIRQELKKNEIAVIVEKIVNLATSHWQTALTTFVMIAILLGLSITVFVRYKTANRRAWENLAHAQALIYQHKTDEAINFLKTFIQSFSTTQAACHAGLNLADIYIDTGKYSESINTLKKLADARRKNILLPYIYNKLAYSYLQNGQINEAVQYYSKIINDYTDHWLTAYVFNQLAKCYAVKGDSENRKKYLENLVKHYPGTEWSDEANRQLKEIESN